MLFHANHLSSSEAGDYHQVQFALQNDADDVEGPYLLIQRQIEDLDGGVCYIETHDEKYIGHFYVTRLDLSPSRLLLEIDRPALNVIEVTFEMTSPDFDEVARIIGMINGE